MRRLCLNLSEIDRIFQTASFFDIAPIVSEKTAVFPGDQHFVRKHLLEFKAGHHLDLSSIQTTLHIGAHADAPSHYALNGIGISDVNPRNYIGRTWVAQTQIGGPDHQVSWSDLSVPTQRWITSQATGQSKKGGSEGLDSRWRFLLATNTFSDPNQWTSGFASFDPTLIDELHAHGCCLVGIDTPSVDPETSKELLAHAALHRNQLSVLEGLVLAHVPEGEYFLVSQPLRIESADASPVRALLFNF